MKKLLILLFSIFFLSSPSVFADDLYVDFFAPELDFTLSKFCHKQPNVQERQGVYYFPNKEEGISATSICVYKDAYGQYASKGKLKNGKLDGKWTTWYKNGQIMEEYNVKDNKPDGKLTFWHENGQIKLETNFKNGNEDGKRTIWYENGQKESEGNFKDNLKEGFWIFWQKNGLIDIRGNFKNDKKDGIWYEFVPLGLRWNKVVYKDGNCISEYCD